MATTDVWRSKLNTKYAKIDIDSWDATLKAQLRSLKQRAENKRCFDCGADDVTWASPKLGVFICVACSDVHRAAGAHITCVKNFNTYLWGPDEVALMTAVGNKRGRELYGQGMIDPAADKNSKVVSCTQKYGCPDVQRLVSKEIVDAKAHDHPATTGGVQKAAACPRQSTSVNLLADLFSPGSMGGSKHDEKAHGKIQNQVFMTTSDHGVSQAHAQKAFAASAADLLSHHPYEHRTCLSSPQKPIPDIFVDLLTPDSIPTAKQPEECRAGLRSMQTTRIGQRADLMQGGLEDFIFGTKAHPGARNCESVKNVEDLFEGWETWQ